MLVCPTGGGATGRLAGTNAPTITTNGITPVSACTTADRPVRVNCAIATEAGEQRRCSRREPPAPHTSRRTGQEPPAPRTTKHPRAGHAGQLLFSQPHRRYPYRSRDHVLPPIGRGRYPPLSAPNDYSCRRRPPHAPAATD